MIVYSILTLYVLWVFYLAVMALLNAKEKGTISKPALWLGYPVLLIGVVLDFVVNVTIMSVIYLELPREWLVTKRLSRHIKHGKDWRHKLSKWICSNLLDTFDPDHRGHCR